MFSWWPVRSQQRQRQAMRRLQRYRLIVVTASWDGEWERDWRTRARCPATAREKWRRKFPQAASPSLRVRSGERRDQAFFAGVPESQRWRELAESCVNGRSAYRRLRAGNKPERRRMVGDGCCAMCQQSWTVARPHASAPWPHVASPVVVHDHASWPDGRADLREVC